ncbi:MAG: ABC transporter permease [Bacilli bacterium]|nr:ABC transporter permease [Bacilli bacterium]
MFKHNIIYSFKLLIKNKVLIFWTLFFPLILATFFHLAFSNISDSEKLNIIDIAIIENELLDNNSYFKESFVYLSSSNENQLFDTIFTTEEDAKELLTNNEIVGYIVLNGDGPSLVVKNSDINTTILKYVIEEINQNSIIINNTLESSVNQNTTINDISNQIISYLSSSNISITDQSSDNVDYMMLPFYSLVAMTALYGGILGVAMINYFLANMSSVGKRVSVSPTKKSILILSGVIASYIIQLLGISLLMFYTSVILNINYGSNVFLVFLLGLVGSLAGLSFGIAVSSLFKVNEDTKTGIIISVTMLGCFLSGMMISSLKYIIDKYIPIVNLFNPASMITDGLYSLYCYDNFNKYWFDIMSLLIFSLLLILLSITSLRRQKYDSI